MRYEHVQSAPFYLILRLPSCAMFSGAWFVPQQLALMFKTLTVRDEGDSLRIQFGPLPIFGRSILFANIDRGERRFSMALEFTLIVDGGSGIFGDFIALISL